MSKEEENKYPFGFEGEFKNILEEVGDNADWSDIESLKDRCMQVCKDYHQEQLKGVTDETIMEMIENRYNGDSEKEKGVLIGYWIGATEMAEKLKDQAK